MNNGILRRLGLIFASRPGRNAPQDQSPAERRKHLPGTSVEINPIVYKGL